MKDCSYVEVTTTVRLVQFDAGSGPKVKSHQDIFLCNSPDLTCLHIDLLSFVVILKKIAKPRFVIYFAYGENERCCPFSFTSNFALGLDGNLNNPGHLSVFTFPHTTGAVGGLVFRRQTIKYLDFLSQILGPICHLIGLNGLKLALPVTQSPLYISNWPNLSYIGA